LLFTPTRDRSGRVSVPPPPLQSAMPATQPSPAPASSPPSPPAIIGPQPAPAALQEQPYPVEQQGAPVLTWVLPHEGPRDVARRAAHSLSREAFGDVEKCR